MHIFTFLYLLPRKYEIWLIVKWCKRLQYFDIYSWKLTKRSLMEKRLCSAQSKAIAQSLFEKYFTCSYQNDFRRWDWKVLFQFIGRAFRRNDFRQISDQSSKLYSLLTIGLKNTSSRFQSEFFGERMLCVPVLLRKTMVWMHRKWEAGWGSARSFVAYMN